MHPLDGPHLKISRAKSEIERLRGQEEIFRQQSNYHVVRAEVNPDSGNYIYRAKISGSPPSPEWSIDIGEIAHNLRSALNHLIFQLALLNESLETVARDKSLQFPIFGNEAEFRTKGRRMIKFLCPKHQTLIERLQPYNGGDGDYPLIWLEEINNADKHRLIQVVGAKIGAGPMIVWWGGNEAIREPYMYNIGLTILEDGTKILEAPPNVHVDTELLPLIAFWQGCEAVKGKGVISTLNKIAACVSNIIESFVSEF